MPGDVDGPSGLHDGPELVMPFVACKSQGGPYTDDAFVAGYQIGQLAAEAEALVPGRSIQAIIYTNLERQADLVAMWKDCSIELRVSQEAPGWTNVKLTKHL